jgi:alpha-glucosidase
MISHYREETHMKFLTIALLALSTTVLAATHSLNLKEGNLDLKVSLEKGNLFYKLYKNNVLVIRKSKLGNQLRGIDLTNNLKVTNVTRYQNNSSWDMIWGEFATVQDLHKGMKLELTNGNIKMNIDFRLYPDGLAFRYEFPEQKALNSFEIIDESTEFRLKRNDRAWWTPAFQDNRYEYLYNNNAIAELNVVHTPLTVEKINGPVVSFHEARLLDYTSYALKRTAPDTLKVDLYPWANTDTRVYGETPLVSPWRTVQVAIDPAKLVESTMILNLNDPHNENTDYSYLSTGKYVGVWWGMHLGKYTWGRTDRHGATNDNVKKYIDFAAKYDIQGVLVEGWNIGWDGDWYSNGDIFIFDQPYPHYDFAGLSKYALERGVTLVGHHETSSIITNYEKQLDNAYAYLNKHGVKAVKTGYVGTRLDRKEWHHGQYGVNHYTKAMKKGHDTQVMMVVHEPIKQTGLRRTYPTLMSAEGVRGQEYNAWGMPGNTPAHTTIVPFTRSLAGPVDFTPGAMDVLFNNWRPNSRVPTTIAKQLALYVVIYSPWQMLCDLPENYEARPDAMEFLTSVPTNWSKTVGLNSKIGEFATIARKDRDSDNWYVGAITNENGRVITIDLDFLDKDAWYTVKGYQDARNASWTVNPHAMEVYQTRVRGGDTGYDLYLAPGGGVALEFIKE